MFQILERQSMSNPLKSRFSSLSMAILASLAVSAVAQAAVTSSATTTVKGRAPVITVPTVTYADVNTNGVIDTGDTLTAVDGTFSDADTDIKTASSYRWSDGTADRGTAASYTLVAADLAKTITLYTKARTDSTITDPAEGVEVTGPGTVVVTGGTLLSVAITGYVSGNPQVASVLTATPTCVTTCTGTTYQWKLETAVGSGVYSNIAGATSSTYSPVKGDQKRKIQVVAS
jgi:hypothetical protein